MRKSFNTILVAVFLQLSLPALSANGNWPQHGFNAAETRHSPLTTIHSQNVSRLGLAWETSLDSSRGLEATPIVIDGIMYLTSNWSRVYALDARTGSILWKFDPKVPGEWAAKGCCDVVNRGVAVANERVFVGTFDGRLIALNANDGTVLWEVNTIDRTKPYTITGAPRVVGDKVLIGNGGGDFGVRGYVSAYAVADGSLSWRFYTVPGGADGPFEHQELAEAVKTWDRDSLWETGLGGTVWDSMAFDPELNLVYVGTGNGFPWPRFQRSPSGGDNLFLSSILALNADTGRLVWHYQTTPGDSWDYTATQHIVLADIKWQGKPRKVLFQAPKNGFFYIVDRSNGELLSANNYVHVSWASHVDLKTGRPISNASADYSKGERLVMPSTLGGHNWHPMSWNPSTGLVYIPAQEAATYFYPDRFTVLMAGAGPRNKIDIVPDDTFGTAKLLAWDPIVGAARWTVAYPMFSNAGVLSTAGNLVVQGDGEGFLNFYDASNGSVLQRIEIGTGIIAPPISYDMDGIQYISVLAGWGGALFSHAESGVAARRHSNSGRVISLKLGGGKVPLPVAQPAISSRLPGPALRELNVHAQRGRDVYEAHCGSCHGWFGHNGLLPDLRRSPPELIDELEPIVIDGALKERGMPSFDGQISEQELDDLKVFLRAVRAE